MYRLFVEPFVTSPTLREGLMAATFAAIACGLVGTWVVLRGMTFIGDALAHGVVPGLAIAAVLGLNLTLGAAVSALVMVLGVNAVNRVSRLPRDVGIGLLFVGMLALGVLIISSTRSFAGDLTSFLFGGIAGISRGDLQLGAVVAVGCAAGVAIGYRPLLAVSFSEVAARFAGFRPGRVEAGLLVLVTAAVIGSFRAVGTLLVFALIVAPPAAAFQLVRRVPAALVLSVVLAEVAVVAGLLVSWHHRLAPGAAIAVASVGVFALAVVTGAVRTAVEGRTSGPVEAAAH